MEISFQWSQLVLIALTDETSEINIGDNSYQLRKVTEIFNCTKVGLKIVTSDYHNNLNSTKVGYTSANVSWTNISENITYASKR